MEHTFETYESRKRYDLFSYRLIVTACFLVLLPVAAVARMGGWRWHPWSAEAGGYRSIVKEARRVAGTVASLAISA